MIKPARMITKSRPPVPVRGKRGEVGRFVTLRSGQKIFIPKGGGSKWADVRDEIPVGAKREALPTKIGLWSVEPKTQRTILGGVTKEEFAGFGAPGLKTHMDVESGMGGELRVTGSFEDPKTGRGIGRFEHTIHISPLDKKKVWHVDRLEFSRDFQNRGLATALYERQIELARKMGCDRMELIADGTIGRYAWAKKGYEYSNPKAAEFRARVFKKWAKERGIRPPYGGWPKFSSPRDFATLKTDQTLYGDDITNPDVPADMVLEVGKAFMLDDVGGHMDWGGELKL